LPRFQPGNIDKNAKIFEDVNAMAAKKGCTPSQLALAWVHHQGNDVCPIPGTTKIENFNQNVGALSVKLTPDEMAELESYAAAGEVLVTVILKWPTPGRTLRPRHCLLGNLSSQSGIFNSITVTLLYLQTVGLQKMLRCTLQKHPYDACLIASYDVWYLVCIACLVLYQEYLP